MIEILRQIGDHPRMCGEHVRRQSVRQLLTGIIPACAGSTQTHRLHDQPRRDHPRMCGEHGTPFSSSLSLMGSSPHVRGARRDMDPVQPAAGIIPACAGSTTGSPGRAHSRRDHPRMCGEHISTVGCHDVKAGSSPHVRGARGLLLPRGIVLGIIPACAGSTSYLAAIFHLPRDHPRMCGEHRNIIACICVSLGSSPHVRGAQKHCRHRRGVPGIIPACAGSTSTPTTRNPTQWDHPRMCGEHSSAASPPSLD